MNLLFIAYTFPPIPYAGTYRCLRLARYFPRNLANIHVLTINVQRDIPNDFELLSQVPAHVTVHRTRIFDPWRWCKNHFFKDHGNIAFRYLHKAVTKPLRIFTLPDHMVGWIFTLLPAAFRIIRQRNIDVVIVSSPPVSTLIAAYILRRTRRVKLVLDLRDPVIGNVFEAELNNRKTLSGRIEIGIRKIVRRLAFRHADLIIANTQTHKRILQSLLGSQKPIEVLKNAYDEADFAGLDTELYDKFTIVHAGTIEGLRNCTALFEALGRLVHEQKCRKLQIIFCGIISSKILAEIDHYRLRDFVVVKGLIPHSRVMPLMGKAHLLLLLKAEDKNSIDHIPAKFYEYLGAGRKILYLGPPRSEVAGMISELNAGYVIDNDADVVYQVLKRAYGQFMAGEKGEFVLTHSEIARYSARNMAGTLAHYISRRLALP